MITNEDIILRLKAFLSNYDKNNMSIMNVIKEKNKECWVYKNKEEYFPFSLERFDDKREIVIDYEGSVKNKKINEKIVFFELIEKLSNILQEEYRGWYVFLTPKMQNFLGNYIANARTIRSIWKVIEKMDEVQFFNKKDIKKIASVTAKEDIIEILKELKILKCMYVSKNYYVLEEKEENHPKLACLFEQLINRSFPIFYELEEEMCEENDSNILDNLIDLALQTKDKEWFYELTNKKKQSSV